MKGLSSKLAGKRFGSWTVIEYIPWSSGKWLCVCDCGVKDDVFGWNLKSGHTTRCNDCRRKSVFKHGHSNNPSKREYVTPTYSSWQAMKKRCCNKMSKAYPRYGGRGIKICDRWINSFENFLADMGERPDGKSLERKNGRKGYSPENCEWATDLEQQNNKENNILITLNGKTKTLSDWCRELKVGYVMAYTRIRNGTDPVKALTARRSEVRKNTRWLTIDGEKLSVSEWAKKSGNRYGLVMLRLCSGWEPKRAVFEEPRAKRKSVVEHLITGRHVP